MRRKITESSVEAKEPAVDLPELTPQQMEFVNGLLAGKTAADAYRAAYDCSTMGKNSVWVAASRLRHHTNVELWLSIARKSYLGNAKVSLENHILELRRMREIALESGNIGAAVQAEMAAGKASGLYVERYADVTDTDPIAVLNDIARESPKLALVLAQEYGIPWQPPTDQNVLPEPVAVSDSAPTTTTRH